MLQTKSKNLIIKIAIAGSAILSSITYVMLKSINNKMRNTSSYQEATKIFYSEEFPKQYLGEPIVEKQAHFLDRSSYGSEGKFRWISFGVEGPKKRGYFKYWFSSDNEGHHTLLKIALLDTSLESVFEKHIIPKIKP